MTAGAGQLLAVVLAVLPGAMAIGTLAFKGGKWVQSVDRRLESHSSLLEAMRHDMSRLFRRVRSSTVVKDSPLRLSELGEKTAEETSSLGMGETHGRASAGQGRR